MCPLYEIEGCKGTLSPSSSPTFPQSYHSPFSQAAMLPPLTSHKLFQKGKPKQSLPLKCTRILVVYWPGDHQYSVARGSRTTTGSLALLQGDLDTIRDGDAWILSIGSQAKLPRAARLAGAYLLADLASICVAGRRAGRSTWPLKEKHYLGQSGGGLVVAGS